MWNNQPATAIAIMWTSEAVRRSRNFNYLNSKREKEREREEQQVSQNNLEFIHQSLHSESEWVS